MELQALTLPESRNFRPFIKTFQIFKQLTPNLLHINSYEFSINKRICKIVEKLDSLAISLASFSDYRLSLTISSSLFLLDQIYEHFNSFSLKIKNKLLLWDSSIFPIYNELSLLWLSLNLPFNYQPSISKDIFLQIFKKKFNKIASDQKTCDLVEVFYQISTCHWLKINTPSFEDLRNIMLEIVAHTIVMEIAEKSDAFEEKLLSKALYESIIFLTQEKKELVSEMGFVNIFRIKLGNRCFEGTMNEEAENTVRKYYNFCKRFILYDFPISNIENNVIKASLIMIRDTIYRLKMRMISFIDKKMRNLFKKLEISLDNVYFASAQKFRSQSNQLMPMLYNEFEEENYRNKGKAEIFLNMLEKTDDISSLVRDWGSYAFQSNRIIRGIDYYFAVTDKYVASEILTECFLNKIEALIFDNIITRSYKKTKDGVFLIVEKRKEVEINRNSINMLLKLMGKAGVLLIYENPKWLVVRISRFWLWEVPESIKYILWNILKGVKEFRMMEIENKGVDLYRRTIEKMKQGKQMISEKIKELERTVQERKKSEFPLLAIEAHLTN